MKKYDVVKKTLTGTIVEDYGDNVFVVEWFDNNGKTVNLETIDGKYLKIIKNKLEEK